MLNEDVMIVAASIACLVGLGLGVSLLWVVIRSAPAPDKQNNTDTREA